MAEFDLPESNYDWLQRRGIARKCLRHGVYHDPHLGCARCREEAFAETRRSMAQKVNVLLENVVWPKVEGSPAEVKACEVEVSAAADAEWSKCPACGKMTLFHYRGTGLHECMNMDCKRVFEE